MSDKASVIYVCMDVCVSVFMRVCDVDRKRVEKRDRVSESVVMVSFKVHMHIGNLTSSYDMFTIVDL